MEKKDPSPIDSFLDAKRNKRAMAVMFRVVFWIVAILIILGLIDAVGRNIPQLRFIFW